MEYLEYEHLDSSPALRGEAGEKCRHGYTRLLLQICQRLGLSCTGAAEKPQCLGTCPLVRASVLNFYGRHSYSNKMNFSTTTLVL